MVPASAAAAPPCDSPPQARTLYSGYGMLESVIVDSQGRIYFTDSANDRVMRADAPGQAPYPLATGIPDGGGFVFLPDGDLVVGTGNAIATGLFGNIAPSAGLVRIDPATGAKSPYASGLQMANGLGIGPAGEIYASSDSGLIAGIDRIGPGGSPVQTHWAPVISPNGLVVDRAGEWLYAAQTFQPAAIKRVRLSNPTQVETFFQAPLADITAGLDGMVRDENDQLYVAGVSGGQVWKVTNPNPQACSLVDLPPFPDGPSAVAFGQGRTGFSHPNLYVVTFGGEVIELAGVRPALPPAGAPDATYSGLSRKVRRKSCKRKKSRAKRKRCRKKKRRKLGSGLR